MDNELRVRALELACSRGDANDAEAIVAEASVFLAFLQPNSATPAAAVVVTAATAGEAEKPKRQRKPTADPIPAGPDPATSATPVQPTSTTSPVTAASPTEAVVTVKMVADLITKLALTNRAAAVAILQDCKVERVSQLAANQLATAYNAAQVALSPAAAASAARSLV